MPGKQPASFFFPVVLLSTLLSFTGCGGKSDERMILELMKDLCHYAEMKDTPSIMIHLADDYIDFEGRDKAKTEYMIRDYFAQYQGIVVNLRSARVEDLTPPEAALQADISLSSGAAKTIRQLFRVSADNYRLNLRLRKSGEQWKVCYAEWRPIGLNELLSGPE